MNICDRLEAFWSGERPERIPLTIYWWLWRDYAEDAAWAPLYEKGLGITYHVPSIKKKFKNMNLVIHSYTECGKRFERKTMKTPVGEILSLDADGWCQEHWLKTAEDYRVMKYIVENTQILPDYEGFTRKQKEIEPNGVALIAIGRTPMQEMLVDMVGLENFSYHLADYEEAVQQLYDAMNKNYKKSVEIIAQGPGRYVAALENFTAETLGPLRFEKFHVPVYNELYPMLQNAGKIVGTHFDGKIASCKELIAKTSINVIESLTEPPEGDMLISECRKAWPKKLFWININGSYYDLPKNELKEKIYSLSRQELERVDTDNSRGFREYILLGGTKNV